MFWFANDNKQKKTIKKESYIQEGYENTDEWKIVSCHANDLFEYLSKPKISKEIEVVNQPGVSSHEIQKVILRKAKELGFTDEKNGLFRNYSNSRLRPDFYLKIGKTGIIIEVERGQTTQNNNDLKDFWKCHICEEAHYLFLFVPNTLIQNTTGKKSREKSYFKVNQHLSSFFERDNYTNVRGLVVFGY